jgi:signal transduction histidine kinase
VGERWATNPDALYRRYQELQTYVGWSEDDVRRVRAVAGLLEAHLAPLIDDFYAEIERHPEAGKVITGGREQIERFKGSLMRWLWELLTGPYDREYVARRWRVGWRHVEIGLDQVYTNVALSRLRAGMIWALRECWLGERDDLIATVRSLNRLLDLDLAIIEDAYQAEYLARQRRIERLAAIGQVAGGVAHELRNPRNVVKTSVYYLLKARNPTPEKTNELLHRIEQHIGVADGVVTALSNFARMPVPDLHPFSVARCVQEALETTSLPEKIRVELDFPATLPPARGDSDQIRIVFANLIRNARDAMPDGGRLTIRGGQVGGGIEVAVSDTGVGIAPENLSRVMEPLYSTKARGLGLGLALSRAILDKHQGSLHPASEPGRGSTFTVRLTAHVRQQ